MLIADLYRKEENLKLFMTKEAYLLKNEINCPGATQAYSCSMCHNIHTSFANTTALTQHFQTTHSLFQHHYMCDFEDCDCALFNLNHMTERHRKQVHAANFEYMPKRVPIHELSKPEEALLFTIAPQTLTSPGYAAPIGTQKFEGVSWRGYVNHHLAANRLPEVSTQLVQIWNEWIRVVI